MGKEEINEYKAKLDDEILYLLRLKAMHEGIVEQGKDLNTHDSLYNYLMNDDDYLQKENGEYFKSLAFEIGVKDGDKEKKRIAVKMENVWKTIVDQIKKKLGAKYKNVGTVRFGNLVLSRDEAREEMAKVFGFESYEDMDTAVYDPEYKYVPTVELLTVENQDFIAAVLGYQSWADVHGESDVASKVSTTSLKRLYGRAKHDRKLGIDIHNDIAMFICDKKWDEMIKEIDNITKNLENRCIFGDSSAMVALPNAIARPMDIYSTQLSPDDNVRIIFTNGNKMILEYQGEDYYKVLESQSEHLKVGYQFVLTEMHIGKPFGTNRILDADGYDLASQYTSREIKSLAIRRGSNAPKDQDACTVLNSLTL